jgi:uncharacterized protein YggU (UPF0235/DUF167 family)
MRGASTRLRLRVSPGARRTRIVGRHGDGWKVRVTEAAERGRANDAVCRLLADTLGLPRDGVTLVAGHAARDKVVELDGIAQDETERRLTQATAPGKDS